MSVQKQNELLEMLVSCGSSEDDALETVILMVNDMEVEDE